MRERVLVDATTLAADLQVGTGPDPAEGRPVVLDVRWALGMTDGHDQYRAGHLPGAVYVDLETELAAHGSPAEGRHPLPSASAFQQAARRWGVSAGSRVVVYDSVGGTSAARAWWLLRFFGVAEVRILDGGLAAWTAEGLALEPGDVTPEPGDVVVRPGGMPVVDADGAAELADGAGVLLDARAAERYRGEVEPVDPQAGHVPGAVSAPTAENLGADGRFLATGDLRRRFGALGAADTGTVGVYCGSGVTAAHQVAALAVAGVDAVLYPGSWSQWSNDPARPVAVGPSVRASG
jgi:thiosulfate/3-mercaptopyruvate sulfurtransferase